MGWEEEKTTHGERGEKKNEGGVSQKLLRKVSPLEYLR